METTWVYKGKPITADDIPEGAFGFIYKIVYIGPYFPEGELSPTKTELIPGKCYIGKKQLGSIRRKLLTKKEKALPENKRKKYKTIVSESDWNSYNSSSLLLQNEIGILGKDYFHKEILYFVESKTDLTYHEIKEQILHNVLFVPSYNRCVGGTMYVGKVKPPLE